MKLIQKGNYLFDSTIDFIRKIISKSNWNMKKKDI